MNEVKIVCIVLCNLTQIRKIYGLSKLNIIIHMYIIFAKVFYYFAFFRIKHYRFDCF